MRAKHWVGVGIVLGVIGATLAFALDKSDPTALGLSLQPFGGVLLATGALLRRRGDRLDGRRRRRR